MDIESIYQKIIQEVRREGRGFVRLGQNDIEYLIGQVDELLVNRDHKRLEKILCIINHSSALIQKFEEPLIKILMLELPDHIIVFALNASRRHIIEARFQKGIRLEFNFLEAMRKLLYSSSPEVVEWSLRTIEGCGNQGVYFLKEFDKIKPAPWKWFNANQRAVREIIELLERRWRKFEKYQP